MFDDQIRQLDTQTDELLTEARALSEQGLEGDSLARFEEIELSVAETRKRRDAMLRAQSALSDGTAERIPGDSRPIPSDAPTVTLMRHVDPWGEASHYDTVGEVRDRGLAAIERVESERMEPEDRARVQQVIRADTTNESAEYIAAASNPRYFDAFRKILLDPSGRIDWTPEERNAWEVVHNTRVARDMEGETRAALTTANATAIMPVSIDPTILLTSAGASGDFRSFCRNVQISTHAWNGATSAGVTAEWNAESAEVTDATPTISSAQITPVHGDAFCQVSWEVVQDSDFVNQVGRLLADSKNVLEQAAFATGAGGTTAPEGIITKLAATTASRVSATTNASFGFPDVFALVNNLPARYQNNAQWAAHWSIYNLVRQMNPTSMGSSFWVDFAPGIPSTLLGAPANVVSGMFAAPLSTATASADSVLVLGDWSQFVVVDRFPMTITSNNWVLGANRRPTGEYGFLGIFRTGSGTPVTNAFRLLQC